MAEEKCSADNKDMDGMQTTDGEPPVATKMSGLQNDEEVPVVRSLELYLGEKSFKSLARSETP